MSIVMVFGTFDLVHKGHESFLRQAQKYGFVIVVVARDSIVKKLKGRKPLYPERTRASHIRALGIASKVVLGDKDYSLNVINKYKPNVIALGYDQKSFAEFLFGRTAVKIVMLKPFKPNVYKSSLLKTKL
jgi:FAD synthetase